MLFRSIDQSEVHALLEAAASASASASTSNRTSTPTAATTPTQATVSEANYYQIAEDSEDQYQNQRLQYHQPAEAEGEIGFQTVCIIDPETGEPVEHQVEVYQQLQLQHGSMEMEGGYYTDEGAPYSYAHADYAYSHADGDNSDIGVEMDGAVFYVQDEPTITTESINTTTTTIQSTDRKSVV